MNFMFQLSEAHLTAVTRIDIGKCTALKEKGALDSAGSQYKTSLQNRAWLILIILLSLFKPSRFMTNKILNSCSSE